MFQLGLIRLCTSVVFIGERGKAGRRLVFIRRVVIALVLRLLHLNIVLILTLQSLAQLSRSQTETQFVLAVLLDGMHLLSDLDDLFGPLWVLFLFVFGLGFVLLVDSSRQQLNQLVGHIIIKFHQIKLLFI